MADTPSVSERFNAFCLATSLKECLATFQQLTSRCPGRITDIGGQLWSTIPGVKAQSLCEILSAKASQRIYRDGGACEGVSVLVVGAGPCGLRTAIELQLLGARVVVVEKRDAFTRNNVLTLWPFVIGDLKALGASVLIGKFAGGSAVHIPIQQLQCMLLKVALLLGVEVHPNVSFRHTIPPTNEMGWRAVVTAPATHPLAMFEFNVLIGAEGRQKSIDGFKRLEFRGRFAIAITVNFVNGRSVAENGVPEIRTGERAVYQNVIFDELRRRADIDLENILYYKDVTHYFVMTAKRQNLLRHGVLLENREDHAALLASDNVDAGKLCAFARKVAEFVGGAGLKGLPFAKNGAGQPDVAIFDFTTMFAAENACRAIVREGHALFVCLVGDSLLNPFWPTGSGCARGFLSCLDAAYAVRQYANPHNSLLGIIAQRESIYRLLGQTTPTNLQPDYFAYTLDPCSRYRNLNKSMVRPDEVQHLLDTDDAELYADHGLDVNEAQCQPRSITMRLQRSMDDETIGREALKWIKSQLYYLGFVQQLTRASECFTNGQVLVHLIHRFHPGLVDLIAAKNLTKEECNERAFVVLEEDFCIPRAMTAKASVLLVDVPSYIWSTYLDEICDTFRSRAPSVRRENVAAERFKAMYEQRKQITNSVQNLRAIFERSCIRTTTPRRSVSHSNGLNNFRKY